MSRPDNNTERRLNDIQETQAALRDTIDRTPHGHERERLIDQLFRLHDEAEDVLENAMRA